MGLILFIFGMFVVFWIIREVALDQQQRAHGNKHVTWLLDDDEMSRAIHSRVDKERGGKNTKA